MAGGSVVCSIEQRDKECGSSYSCWRSTREEKWDWSKEGQEKCSGPEATVWFRTWRSCSHLQHLTPCHVMHSSSSSVVNGATCPLEGQSDAHRVLRFEDVHSPHYILPADGALAHPLSTFSAGDHVTTFQQHAVDNGVHADATQVFITCQLSSDTICNRNAKLHHMNNGSFTDCVKFSDVAQMLLSYWTVHLRQTSPASYVIIPSKTFYSPVGHTVANIKHPNLLDNSFCSHCFNKINSINLTLFAIWYSAKFDYSIRKKNKNSESKRSCRYPTCGIVPRD